MADLLDTKANNQHELTEANVKQQEKNVIDLQHTHDILTNSFTDGGDQLINMVTKAVLPMKNPICHQQEDRECRGEICRAWVRENCDK